MQIDISQIFEQSDHVLENKSGKEESVFNKEISLTVFRNKDHLRCRFFSEISVLISSGMDLKRSLEILQSGVTKRKDKLAIDEILSIIIKGSSLSQAMEKSEVFSTYDYYTVKIGEETGSLSIVLKELSIFYNKRISQQRQISGALTYPILVLCTTILSLTFMLNFIVPMFEDVFLRFKGDIPGITRLVIALSNSFSKYSLGLFILIAGFSAVIFFNKKKEWYRKLSSKCLIRIPVIGPIIKLTYKTRFCHTLKMLTVSKVHLLEAVSLIKQMIGFYPFECALGDIKNKLAKGFTLSDAMEPHGIFDKKLIAMTRVAEEVNKLDVVYEQLFLQYSEELDTKVKTMNNLLEPVLIIFVGGIVALILISMYMPIFQMGININ